MKIPNPCPRCGHTRAALETRCAECGWKPEPARTPAVIRAEVTVDLFLDAARTISIASLLLITALVAACAAVMMAEPNFGLFVSLVCLAALWRTSVFVTYSKAEGRQLKLGGKLLAFIQATVFVYLTGLATVFTFAAVCVPITLATQNLWLGEFAGYLTAIFACVAILICVPVYRGES